MNFSRPRPGGPEAVEETICAEGRCSATGGLPKTACSASTGPGPEPIARNASPYSQVGRSLYGLGLAAVETTVLTR